MHADLGNHLQAYGVPKEDDVNNEQDYFWAVASSKPHEETPEFRVFAPDVAEKQQPVRQHPTMPRMQPERQQSFNPAPPGIRPNDIPAWMQELLAFRKPQPPVQVPSLPPTLDLQAQRRMQDALAISLLRMINEIRAQGEIKAKILLSRQAPNNKIKSLSEQAHLQALDMLQNIPPYIALIPTQAFETAVRPKNVDYDMIGPELTTSSIPSSHSLPHSLVPLPAVHSSPSCTPSFVPVGAMSAPLPGSTHPPMLRSEPPVGDGQFYGYAPPPHPAGYPFVSQLVPTQRRQSMRGAEEGYYASPVHAGVKKMPAVGDRPLTPPAHGWHAKYSSGVTGVVWDRVHQAWVVSWTLGGKRTFRHFTCKSYGGFDKARDAAIRFRLERNQEIAAYNKKTRDRRG